MMSLSILKCMSCTKYSRLINGKFNNKYALNNIKTVMSTSKSTIPIEYPKVLSIQSKVVHGIVGNNCANYTLQKLGFEVDTIDTVQFSNHTGYGNFQGTRLDPIDFKRIIEAMDENKLLDNIKYILTGYTGSSKLLKQMSYAIKDKINNNDIIYLCDPVLGDNGKLYVPKECIEVYKNDILPLADVITPNHFEAELLSDTEISDIASCMNTCDILHDKGPSIIIITSIPKLSNNENELVLMTSQRNPKKRFILRVNKIDGYFVGTGDLLASLILACLHKYPDDIIKVVEIALSKLYLILKYSAENLPKNINELSHVESTALRELKLVQAQDKLLDNQCLFKAEEL